VTIVSGPVELAAPPVASLRKVTTAREMLSEVKAALPQTDWLIMAAAVADFAPAEVQKHKIKKGKDQEMSLKLSRNPDILEAVASEKGEKLIIGFAAETRDLIDNAREKARNKNLDLIVANDISGNDIGFESEENSGVILDQGDLAVEIPRMTKAGMAEKILDTALTVWEKKGKRKG
jgi:phosphopantothenoylcysteine decarboxylase/phosphopantothenate--cysteine ligase